MMNTLQPGGWYELKQALYTALSTNKVPACLEILNDKYQASDIIFLQETSNVFLAELKKNALMERHVALSLFHCRRRWPTLG
jgi:hypothetical protein